MSITPTKSKGCCHQARTGQFFTKSREPIDIKIAAALHLAGPNYDFTHKQPLQLLGPQPNLNFKTLAVPKTLTIINS